VVWVKKDEKVVVVVVAAVVVAVVGTTGSQCLFVPLRVQTKRDI